MQIPRLLVAFGLSALLAGCGAEASSGSGSEAEATTAAQEIEKVLKGINSSETAEAAKEELATLVDKLIAALPKIPSAEEGKGMLEGIAENAKKAAGAMSGDLTSALGKVSGEIQRIMSNAQASAPIKDVLEKLKGAIPGS
jgi:hypothetical protein